jgi:hypothetical protein
VELNAHLSERLKQAAQKNRIIFYSPFAESTFFLYRDQERLGILAALRKVRSSFLTVRLLFTPEGVYLLLHLNSIFNSLISQILTAFNQERLIPAALCQVRKMLLFPRFFSGEGCKCWHFPVSYTVQM